MKPGSSTSQVEVAVRRAIEASPATAATMATPSSTRIAITDRACVRRQPPAAPSGSMGWARMMLDAVGLT